tara:strand:- start:74 stop:196 length:123 start_codon:yes stop_codon:yes gene_type:complete
LIFIAKKISIKFTFKIDLNDENVAFKTGGRGEIYDFEKLW